MWAISTGELGSGGSSSPPSCASCGSFLPSIETYYSPGVVNDERYQTQLRNLGVGRPWRAYMRERVAELAPITGIPLTSPIAEEDVST